MNFSGASGPAIWMANTIGWPKRTFNLREDDLFNGSFMFVGADNE